MRYAVILPLIFSLVCDGLYADTILLRDGQELKGVIVEDYQNRVVLSTERGEIGLLKKDVDRVVYETTEENLVKLGTFYKDKRDYKLALYYYEAAYKLNPKMKEAADGALLVTNMLLHKREAELEEGLALRQDTEEKMGRPASEEQVLKGTQATEAAQDVDIKGLWETIGIAIENRGPDIVISKVLSSSPADEAGVKEGGVIISLWGKLIKYMLLEDVYELFLDSNVKEMRLVVSRGKSIVLKKTRLFGSAEKMMGGRFSMEFEGLTISEVRPGGPLENMGILKGDRITHLAGRPTRYMPLESAYKLVEEIKTDILDLEIQGEFVFWKGGRDGDN